MVFRIALCFIPWIDFVLPCVFFRRPPHWFFSRTGCGSCRPRSGAPRRRGRFRRVDSSGFAHWYRIAIGRPRLRGEFCAGAEFSPLCAAVTTATNVSLQAGHRTVFPTCSSLIRSRRSQCRHCNSRCAMSVLSKKSRRRQNSGGKTCSSDCSTVYGVLLSIVNCPEQAEPTRTPASGRTSVLRFRSLVPDVTMTGRFRTGK